MRCYFKVYFDDFIVAWSQIYILFPPIAHNQLMHSYFFPFHHQISLSPNNITSSAAVNCFRYHHDNWYYLKLENSSFCVFNHRSLRGPGVPTWSLCRRYPIRCTVSLFVFIRSQIIPHRVCDSSWHHSKAEVVRRKQFLMWNFKIQEELRHWWI